MKNLDKPQGQKPVDKDTSPIMISSSEQDNSSPLKPTSSVAGPSAPQPMGSSSPRPFETGLMNKTSSPKLDMPKLGKRYVFCDLIILQLNYTKFPITVCHLSYLKISQLIKSIPYYCMPSTYKHTNCQYFLVLIFHGANWQNMLRPIKEKSLPYQAMGIVKCMETDFNHKIKQQDLLDQIVDELYENAQ